MRLVLCSILMLFGCAVAATAWLLFREVHEPSYNSKSLSDWLVAYGEASRFYPRPHAADEAIRHIGSNAVPYLLTWLQYEDSLWLRRCAFTLNKAPVGFRCPATNISAWIVNNHIRRNKRYGVAIWGFGIIGSDARSAVPTLAALAVDYKRPRVASRAVRVLQDLGTNALPAMPLLLRSSHSRDPSVASAATFALACLKFAPEKAVPHLAEMASRQDGTSAIRKHTAPPAIRGP